MKTRKKIFLKQVREQYNEYKRILIPAYKSPKKIHIKSVQYYV